VAIGIGSALAALAEADESLAVEHLDRAGEASIGLDAVG
jgi:hypothetical protein